MPIDHSAGPPKAHCLRLLRPFFCARDGVTRAAEALAGLAYEAKEAKRPWTCWAPAEPPDAYVEEILPSVRAFLFGGGAEGCGYLRVPDETASLWFKRGGVCLKAGSAQGSGQSGATGRPGAFEVTLAAPGIEVFLSPHGAGVLSLALAAKQATDLTQIQGLNYRLSQGRPFTRCVFQLPHGERNPNPPPAPDAPLAQRLGHAGGAFGLVELADFLLAPLGPLDYAAMQGQFSVYSVTRFGSGADLADPGVRQALHPFLAALAHVEEPTHPGTLEIPERVLNARHWAAAGSLAAAHLVADQDPPHPFDNQRVPMVLHKYFVPYLVSLLQRIALQRLLGEARVALVTAEPGLVEGGGPEATDKNRDRFGARLAARLRELNGQALAFTVNGRFTEVSVREVHNQFYQLTQTGLRVRDSLGTVQQALRDAEAMDNDRFQGGTLSKIGTVANSLEELVKEAAHNASLVAHVQSKVEWLEVFFVSYYFTALM